MSFLKHQEGVFFAWHNCVNNYNVQQLNIKTVMPESLLNEREFELINIVGAELGSNQRDLSRQLNLSLGMTNMLIRRLVAKGYIRIRQLNKKKVEYFLTPQGFTEKMRKSIKYTLKTIRSIGLIKERLREILIPLYEKGQRNFYVLGESDLASLIDIVLKEQHLVHYHVQHIATMPEGRIEGVVLICTEEFDPQDSPNTCINLIGELASQNHLLWFNQGERYG